MGKRGPRPTPSRILERRGSWRAGARAGEIQPDLTVAVPPSPAWLEGAGRTEWRRVAAQLHALGLLAKVDLALLAVYCSEFGRYVEAREQLARDGAVIKCQELDEAGNITRLEMRAHPACAVAASTARIVRALAQEFGFSPAARVGLKAPAAEEPEAPSGKGALFDARA